MLLLGLAQTCIELPRKKEELQKVSTMKYAALDENGTRENEETHYFEYELTVVAARSLVSISCALDVCVVLCVTNRRHSRSCLNR